jgi:competence protein ComEA
VSKGKVLIRKMTARVIAVLFVAAAVALPACTTRRVYERPANAVIASAEAININIASAAELERLPRIGPKTAEKIVAFRDANGPFLRVEELMQIHGISEKKFFEIKPYLRTD